VNVEVSRTGPQQPAESVRTAPAPFTPATPLGATGPDPSWSVLQRAAGNRATCAVADRQRSAGPAAILLQRNPALTPVGSVPVAPPVTVPTPTPAPPGSGFGQGLRYWAEAGAKAVETANQELVQLRQTATEVANRGLAPGEQAARAGRMSQLLTQAR